MTLYDDDLPGNQAILVNGQTTVERLDDVYSALGAALGYFLANLGCGHLNPDHDERPA